MTRNVPNIVKLSRRRDKNFLRSEYLFNNLEELKENAELFSDAKSIFFYAGELFFEFYNDQRFLNNITRSLYNGGKIYALFGPALYIESRDFLKLAQEYRNNIILLVRKYRDPYHYKIVITNDNDVYGIVDEPHDVDVDTKERNSMLLLKGYEEQLTVLMKKFEKEMERSRRVDINNIMKEFSNKGKTPGGDLYGFITREKCGNTYKKAVHASDEQIEDLRRYLSEPTKPEVSHIMVSGGRSGSLALAM